jgi:hypothetical protein
LRALERGEQHRDLVVGDVRHARGGELARRARDRVAVAQSVLDPSRARLERRAQRARSAPTSSAMCSTAIAPRSGRWFSIAPSSRAVKRGARRETRALRIARTAASRRRATSRSARVSRSAISTRRASSAAWNGVARQSHAPAVSALSTVLDP